MNKFIPVCCLVAVVCLAAADTIRIFDFTRGAISLNETLAPERRGVRVGSPTEGIDGLPVKFLVYRPGNAAWPYISTKPGALKVTDWRQYKVLHCYLAATGNRSSQILITVRDGHNKYKVFPFPINPGFSGRLDIPVDELKKALDLSWIRSVDFAMSKPAQENHLRISALELEDKFSAARVSPGKIVGRTLDIRQLPFRTNGKTRVTRCADGSLEVETAEMHKGDQTCQVVFSLKNLNYNIATHFSFEIELLSDRGNYLGAYLVNCKGVSLWHGAGALAKGAPARGEQQIYDSSITASPLEYFTVTDSGRFSTAQKFRLKKLRFEFRPETVLKQTQYHLDVLKRQGLNAAERASANALQEKLDRAYAKVSGKRFRHGDAEAFLQIAKEVKDKARTGLRNFNNRAAFASGGDYGVGFADSMDLVFLDGPGTELKTGGFNLELAANEYESFQTVVIAGKKKLHQVKVAVDKFTGPGGDILQARCSLVGHSKVPAERNYPRERTEGFYPEMILLNQTTADVEPGESVPFWVRVHAPKGAKPGVYTSRVKISGGNIESREFPLAVKVFDFTLPDKTVLPVVFSFNYHDYDDVYHFAKGSPEREAYIEKVVDFAAEYRIMCDEMYWWIMPTENMDPEREIYYRMLKKLDNAGKLTQFCLGSLYYPGKNWTEDYSITDPHHSEVDVVIRHNAEFLKKHVPILKKLGLFDKAYLYGFDESYPNAVSARILAEIKKDYPQIPVITTMRCADPNRPEVKNIDVWCPPSQRFADRPEMVANFRKAGRKVYWYICDFPRPPQPTFLLETPGAVPRIYMGMMTVKYRPDGFLYWALTCWRKGRQPVGTGPRTDWNPQTAHPGDTAEGNLLYPGENRTILPSIRLENYRDGEEDHCYYALLEQALKAGRGSAEARQKARQLLHIPDTIVRSTGDYSTDPKLIRGERRKVAHAIETLR